MRFLSIEIKGFRNILEAKIDPSKSANLFIGENGQGKTNFLEALFVSLRGQSFRPFVNPKVFKFEKFGEKESNCYIKSELMDSSGQIYDLLFSIDENEKVSFLVNDKKLPKSQLRKKFSIVAFSPEDHSIIRGGPDARRSFLDQLLGDIDFLYLDALTDFEKVLKQRNKLLKDVSENLVPASDLKAWNESYVDYALKIYFMRKEFWPELEKRVLQQVTELSESLGPKLKMEVISDLEKHLKPQDFASKNSLKEGFLSLLESELSKDLATGWTHRGPGRDDFRFLIDGSLDSRHGSSQGQARILALALRWAHARWLSDRLGEEPIVLIDDFSSELDAKHRSSLLSYLASQKLQLFISGTDPNLVDSGPILDYKKYKVFGGNFSPL